MSKKTHQQTRPQFYGGSFALLVVLFVLLIIVGTAYNRPYQGYQGGYGHY